MLLILIHDEDSILILRLAQRECVEKIRSRTGFDHGQEQEFLLSLEFWHNQPISNFI